MSDDREPGKEPAKIVMDDINVAWAKSVVSGDAPHLKIGKMHAHGVTKPIDLDSALSFEIDELRVTDDGKKPVDEKKPQKYFSGFSFSKGDHLKK